jgi:hypothetical protein
VHRLPEVGDVVARATLDINEAGVAFGAVADEAVGTKAGKIITSLYLCIPYLS